MSYKPLKTPTPSWKPTVFDWLRYSGICVTITLNPLQWSIMPNYGHLTNDEWPSPNFQGYRVHWLMFGIRAWIDDGSW
jgi:hypothetical protein